MAVIDPTAGHELIRDLGFLLVPGAPFAEGRAYLIVAIRRSPTLAHFDPELLRYWVSVDGRGMPVETDFADRREQNDFSWGEIRIVDRLGVENVFAAFGGQLARERTADAHTFVFSSAAPIVARGGHSQEREPEANEIDAFIAQLRAAAVPGGELERSIAEVSPVARYAAFVAARLDIGAALESRMGWRAPDRQLLDGERRRLRERHPDEWRDGVELLGAIRTRAARNS